MIRKQRLEDKRNWNPSTVNTNAESVRVPQAVTYGVSLALPSTLLCELRISRSDFKPAAYVPSSLLYRRRSASAVFGVGIGSFPSDGASFCHELEGLPTSSTGFPAHPSVLRIAATDNSD